MDRTPALSRSPRPPLGANDAPEATSKAQPAPLCETRVSGIMLCARRKVCQYWTWGTYMSSDSIVPGDDQSPEVVDLWVRRHVTTGSIMIARYEHNGAIVFDLDEVDLMKTCDHFLYSRTFGTFDTGGNQASSRYGVVRLLIPSPTLTNLAASGQVWINGRVVQTPRPKPPRHEFLLRRLAEQMKS